MKPLSERAWCSIMLAWLLLVFFFYFTHPPTFFDTSGALNPQAETIETSHTYWLKVAATLGIAVWIVWIVSKTGGTILKKLLPEGELTGLEKIVFSATLGFGVVSLATFFLGALQLWYVSVFWAGLILLTLAYFPRTPPKFD